jgi:eukaryotic-like serine/threonine-protein kinase
MVGAGQAQHGERTGEAAAGDQVGGYTLVRLLGTGGMAQTWEAVRRVGEHFEQRVAIKVASRQLIRDQRGRELLAREASIAASLRHPNIASVLDWDDAAGCIVCELIDGADLRLVLREAPSGRLPPSLLVYVLTQIARGLSYAHRRVLRGEISPVIHRDVSPGNVVVDYDGNLKLVDFGIARPARGADVTSDLKGKLSYMSPEQVSGEAVDERVDQYALGVIAYEAASGERPHDGTHEAETLLRITRGNHVPIGKRMPSIPTGLAEVIERMIAVRRDDRFPNMDEVIDALEPFAPPLAVYRNLAALVHRAQPHHTIIRQGQRFVSERVTVEPPAWNAPSESLSRTISVPPSSSPIVSRPGGVTHAFLYNPLDHPDVPKSHKRWRVPDRSSPARTWLLGGAALALLLAVGAWATLSTTEAPPPPSAQKPPAPAVEAASPPALLVGASPPPISAPAEPSPITLTPDTPAARDLDTKDEAGELDAPSADVGRKERHASARTRDARSGADGDELSGARDGRRSGAGKATLRVKVFPWGQVWIDGVSRGSVPPMLEAKVSPGKHIVAVGRDVPVRTRTVTVSARQQEVLSFDLSTW